MNQTERIQAAAEESIRMRDKYTDPIRKQTTEALYQGSLQVQAEIARLNIIDISDGAAIRLAQLKGIETDITRIIREMETGLGRIITGTVEASYGKGVESVIREFKEIGFVGFKDLQQREIELAVSQAMSLVDRAALDFLANFSLQLLGEVSNQLLDAIKKQISVGLLTGDSIAKISQNIGRVIKEPEAFRKAGKTVFKTAQNRVDLITRTEVMRSHSQGRMKYYLDNGVKTVRWYTALDNRTCSQCGPLHEQEFKIDEVPSLPLHPACRCLVIAVVEALKRAA